MVRLGRDPAGEKIEGRARAAETMVAALQSFLAYQRGHLKPRSYVEAERHLLKHCKPLHGLQLAKIDRRTIAARISAIASKSGPVAANRCRASLSAFLLGLCGKDCSTAIRSSAPTSSRRNRARVC